MKLCDFRDLIDEVCRMSSDLTCCVNDAQRAAWAKRAEKLRWRVWCAGDPPKKANERDRQRFARSVSRLDAEVSTNLPLVFEDDKSVLGL